MLRDSLLAILYHLQVNPKQYCLDDGNQMNKYVCIQEYDAWKVYFNENNKRIEERSFNTESDAIIIFYPF